MDDNAAKQQVRHSLSPGVRLLRTLRGHNGWIGRIAWSPDGRMLASPSVDATIRLWDAATGDCLRMLEGHNGAVYSVAFQRAGRVMASAGQDNTVRLWEPKSGRLVLTNRGHTRHTNCLAFDPVGRYLASGSNDHTIKLWDVKSGQLFQEIEINDEHPTNLAWNSDGLASGGLHLRLWDTASRRAIRTFAGYGTNAGVAFAPKEKTIASGGRGFTVVLWDITSGRVLRTLEGHTKAVNCVAFISTGCLIASKSSDDTIRLWRTDTGDCVATIPELASTNWEPSLAFHPHLPLLATVGTEGGDRDCVIHIFELDLAVVLGQVVEPGVRYVNAKVVLVGDTGVGKTGLSLVLSGQPYKETDSTAGRHVWMFDSRDVEVSKGMAQTRETLLWDLAGQPGYRLIHQLHLHEVAVALVVFDARSETDPLAGVRHWERALRLAQQRQGIPGMLMKKFLVSARNDRGGVSIGEDRLQAILRDFGFDGYFKTSAKEGWRVRELRAAIEQAISWEDLPVVSSSQLFADIKSFLLKEKNTGRLLAPAGELYDDFVRMHPDSTARAVNLRDQFSTCIGRLENRDLIRRLTFGEYVLLQPELLDAYASAMVNAAKDEPDGLGSLAEEVALTGRFFVPKEQQIADSGQEQLLLHATVEELVRYDLALRENADDGRYLVFPSQLNRDYEDAPEPGGKAVAISFDGPVQSLYSTLVVRLGHSGLFASGRAGMWRNAAVFTAKTDGKCGLLLHEFAEGRGRLILFFDERTSAETRFHFEEFVVAHTRRRALDGTLELVRFFVCAECGDPVPENYVRRLRERSTMTFGCPCGGTVSLAEPRERTYFRSQLETMDNSADRQRDFDAFIVSAKGETSTKSFQEWAGGERLTLAIAFTDVVGSTALGEEIRDEAMIDVRRAHFTKSRKLISQFKGREIKTIGDSFMTAFRSADAALDYARALEEHTGHPRVQIRAGIHIGPMHVEEGDVFGGTVNFAARVIGAIKDAEIWLSDRAKEDIDRLGAAQHKHLTWKRHEGIAMKGFPGTFTLWSLKNLKSLRGA